MITEGYAGKGHKGFYRNRERIVLKFTTKGMFYLPIWFVPLVKKKVVKDPSLVFW